MTTTALSPDGVRRAPKVTGAFTGFLTRAGRRRYDVGGGTTVLDRRISTVVTPSEASQVLGVLATRRHDQV